MEITKFLGVRYSLTGDTALQIGEFSDSKNIRITADYKARKREGYKHTITALNSPIRGQWSGYIGGVWHNIFACNGHLYKRSGATKTDLGTLTDANTAFFYFGSKLYIINGHEYKSYDGTTLADVVGYVPLVAISTPPAGGGTDYESVNVLTGKKRQKFSGDGAATEYVLRESTLTSIDKVYVNGVLKTVTTDYTVNLTTGKVIPVSAAAFSTGVNNIEIHWTKGTGTRSEVLGYTQAMLYGGKNDTRVFLFGDGTNKIHYSELADGIPSAEYFCSLSNMKIGSEENKVTDILKQYDRQVIFTNQGSYYSEYATHTLESGLVIYSPPVYPLNDKIGNIPIGQGKLIQNNPFTITSGVYQWISTSVRDERNATFMSERVQPMLDGLDLSTAITFDYEELGEYWLCVGTKAYVYNYRNDTWYAFEFSHTPTSFITIDGVLFMGTSDGNIMEWAKYLIDDIPDYLTDDGEAILSFLETGFMDFGESWRRKFLNFGWIGLKPETKSRCFVEWESDYDTSTDPEVIYYSILDFRNIDFSDFSFWVNYNPQPFRVKLKAKKFTFFKLILTNNSETETMTILSLTLPALVGGVAK